MLYELPQPTDRAKSHIAAKIVAREFGSKAIADRRVVIGEPQCHYAVRMNTEHFWFGARFSARSYVVQGTHKQIAKLIVPFYASLVIPNEGMLANIALPRASSELGISVFVGEVGHGPIASKALCSADVRGQLGRLDFASIREAFISPVQLRVVGHFSDPIEAAKQVATQRDLLECLFKYAMPPNPSLHTDALGLSRPLRGKGRASPRRAGKRER